MNLISFSLFGENRRYVDGLIRNLQLARELYPGWKCVVYIPNLFQHGLRDAAMNGAIIYTGDKTVGPVFWRFQAYDHMQFDYLIFRDADSRIMPREVAAVNEWMASGKKLHTMRDHPAHARPINAGMWGIKSGALGLRSMHELIVSWAPTPRIDYGADQEFLQEVVWPILAEDSLQHDSVCREAYPGAVPFPTKRDGSPRFVGEVFLINSNGEEYPRELDWESIDPNKD